MNNRDLSQALRSVASVIESLPEFARPLQVDFSQGQTRIQLAWQDFRRVFAKAKYWRDYTHERMEATTSGITWRACSPLPDVEPREVATCGIIAGDGGDDDLALAPLPSVCVLGQPIPVVGEVGDGGHVTLYPAGHEEVGYVE
jgi:hypothetical protein